MNDNFINQAWSIVPRSRRSIHSHRFCNHSCCNRMGRYGINNQKSSSTIQNLRTLRPDHDEVDNVMSKHCRLPLNKHENCSYCCRYCGGCDAPTILPSEQLERRIYCSCPSERYMNNRRRSLTNNKRPAISSDEDDFLCVAANTLAKSLPNRLPSYYDYSDSVDEGHQNANQEYITTEDSHSSSSFLQDSFHTAQRAQNLSSSSNIFESSRERTPISRKRPNKFFKLMAAIVSLVIATIGVYMVSQESSRDVYDDVMLFKELHQIGQKYGINNNVILQIQSGVSTIYKRSDTASFIFAYKSESHKGSEHFKQFVNDIAGVAAQYLRNDTGRVHHLVVSHEDLDMEEHGQLVSKFRRLFNDRGVMLFEHLEMVPVHLAMAFHYYCDEFNPLAKRSAVLFTLDLSNCSMTTDQEVWHALIEKCLKTKWDGLSSDNLGPLLTRVVSIIVDVTKHF